MKNHLYFLLFIFALAFSATAFKCGGDLIKDVNKLNDEMLKKQVAALSVQTTTASGVFVNAVAPPSTEQMRAIDAAFDLREKQIETFGLTNQLARNQHNVLIVPSERDFNSDGIYAPAFAVPIICSGLYNKAFDDPYCGSIYDKGKLMINGAAAHKYVNFVLAAERVIMDGEFNKWMVADYRRNFVDFMFAVNFGAEHTAQAKDNIGLFQQNAVHLNGGHPLMPMSEQIVEEILRKNSLGSEVKFVDSLSGAIRFKRFNRPDCAPAPEGDRRIMCVVR